MLTPEKLKQSTVQNTSTPYTNDLKTSSSDSKSDFEYVPIDMENVRKHDTNKQDTSLPTKQNTSSDSSSKGFDLINELQKPYIENKTSNSNRHSRQAAIRSHKRQGNAPNPSQNGGTSRQSQNMNGHHQGSSQQTSHYHHHQRHNRHSSASNNENSGSDDDACSSVSSVTSDNVGLKIVQALERMEENLHDVLDRLDSIEGNMKALTQPVTPWWKIYAPSKMMIIWTLWPVIVNLIFYYFWRKKMRKRLRKC